MRYQGQKKYFAQNKYEGFPLDNVVKASQPPYFYSIDSGDVMTRGTRMGLTNFAQVTVGRWTDVAVKHPNLTHIVLQRLPRGI